MFISFWKHTHTTLIYYFSTYLSMIYYLCHVSIIFVMEPSDIFITPDSAFSFYISLDSIVYFNKISFKFKSYSVLINKSYFHRAWWKSAFIDRCKQLCSLNTYQFSLCPDISRIHIHCTVTIDFVSAWIVDAPRSVPITPYSYVTFILS